MRNNPQDIVVYEDVLYFSALSDGGRKDIELWAYDGTGYPYLVEDIYEGPSGSHPINFTEFDGRLYFTARDANGAELWVLH